ncbi:MAG: hypothetical protein Unbinned7358contig1001_14 [Prokaryotic dsDNA virus sp.]|nr:MAG: hypothetical protein Unbinned7358contig1001_14 [Prokaryotic dsDNA virus sp.]
MRIYSDPAREADPNALPDVEVFWWTDYDHHVDDPSMEPGFYFWWCFPGCLPESSPFGPFETESEAVEAAQDYH